MGATKCSKILCLILAVVSNIAGRWPPTPIPPPLRDGADRSEISSQVMFQAAEAKRFQFYGDRRNTVIIDSAAPVCWSDVDFFVCDRSDNRVASSINGERIPENVRRCIGTTREQALDIVSISPTRSVSWAIRKQTVSATAPSHLNGKYRLVESSGQPASIAIKEKPSFANGELVSRYVFINAALLSTGDDVETWIDHRTDSTTQIHYLDPDWILQTGVNMSNLIKPSAVFSFSVEKILGYTGLEAMHPQALDSVEEQLSQSSDVLEGIVTGEFIGDLDSEYVVPVHAWSGNKGGIVQLVGDWPLTRRSWRSPFPVFACSEANDRYIDKAKTLYDTL